MMWLRNLLFIGLILAGFVALRASLFPLSAKRGAAQQLTAVEEDNDIADVVAEVNAAFRREWAEHQLQPASLAPELAVARRLSLALTGSIPSLEEIRQLQKLSEEQRLPTWTRYLLQDRRYADYFAERLARTYVGAADGPFLIYRRRRFVTWLSDQLLAQRSHGDLVRELITGEGLWTDHPETNFITVTVDPEIKKPDAEKLAGRVARAFLGIRLDCAQCHDHPFADWRQQDFHALAAFFAQTQQGFTGIRDGAGEHEMETRRSGRKQVIAPAVPFSPELLPAEGTRRQRLAQWVTDPGNDHFARATVWQIWTLLFGRPMLPVDEVETSGTAPLALAILARDFAAHNHDLQRLIRVIAASEVFRLDSAAAHEITEAHLAAWAAFPLIRLRPEQVVGSVQQAASLQTLNNDSPLLVRLATLSAERDFVRRYGDTGEDEFAERGGTIPQRLLLMNGDLVQQKTKDDLFNAAHLIAQLAPDDRAAIETAYLCVLTRPPTAAEMDHFLKRMDNARGKERSQRLEDLYWTLINSTEFSWNH